MKISDWPTDERPREKLLKHGPDCLSDAELLAIFLRTGMKGTSAVDLARQLLLKFGSLRQLLNAEQNIICKIKGLGTAKYVQLQAVLEISRRHAYETLQRKDVLSNVEETRQYLVTKLRDEKNELFAMLLLDNKHRVIKYMPVFQGTIDCASVYPRVLVQIALQHNAAAVILAHNHPSGLAEPSMADKQITECIVNAMELLDIRVLDHFVIGDGEVVSFAERGWL